MSLSTFPSAMTDRLLGQSLWAKDIIFVISDGYLDGMQAWISSYHGTRQSSRLIFICIDEQLHFILFEI